LRLALLGRRLELFPVGHDDAVVVLGVLEIILCQHPVTRRLGVACQGKVFLRNMRRCAAHFHVWSVRFETPRQRVLPLALVISTTATAVVVVATATTAVLLMLTWPHWRICSRWLSVFRL
jgi:hypothetical protein